MAMLDIRNFTRSNPPTFPYRKALEAVLPGWDISLAFVGEKRARRINETLRKKTYTPNVLSYVTGTKSGEILICPPVARMQASAYGLTPTAFVGLLFIHGLLHLKGRAHGTTMERQERALLARFISVPKQVPPHGSTHRNRH